MRQLIDVIEGLVTATSIVGGESVDAINHTLENVDWSAKLKKHTAQSIPVVDAWLDEACAHSGQYGSNPHMIAEAVLEVRDEIQWHEAYAEFDDEPDMAAFRRSYAWCSVIGAHAPLHSTKIEAGLTLQGPDTYYPPHVHQAEEIYWLIGGDGDWKIGSEPWFGVEPGDMMFHPSGVRHAMQTNTAPMLAMWL